MNIVFKYKLRKILRKISKELGIEISEIEDAEKIYKSKKRSFVIKGQQNGSEIKYFLKFQKSRDTRDEIAGDLFLEKKLPKPKIIMKSDTLDWILFENIEGELMAQYLLSCEAEDNIDKFLEKERRKEELLMKMYLTNKSEINWNQYLNLRTNKLFYKRLLGNRYKKYYYKTKVSKLLKHNIVLNGQDTNLSLKKIVDEIENKYTDPKSEHETIRVSPGHGDAHHGNIMINEEIEFIDSEYSDTIPPLMELAKPYYNDFIGFMFFYDQEELQNVFKLLNTEISNDKIYINIKCNNLNQNRLSILKTKLESRKEICNSKTKDFLRLNDYLVMCHLLTKNPNKYKDEVLYLFIAFTAILYSFDPFGPESISDFLKD